MEKRVHGGEVRELIITSGKTYSRENLITTIHESFGKETKFFSCADDNMSADELITFFEKHGKISAPDYNFSESLDHVCKT